MYYTNIHFNKFLVVQNFKIANGTNGTIKLSFVLKLNYAAVHLKVPDLLPEVFHKSYIKWIVFHIQVFWLLFSRFEFLAETVQLLQTGHIETNFH